MEDAAEAPKLRKRSEAARGSAPRWSLPEGLDGFAVGGESILSSAERPINWIVEGLIAETDSVLYCGEEKTTFKTFAMLDLAIARICGEPWMGFNVKQCGERRVLIVSAETSLDACARRVVQLCKGRDVDARQVVPYLYIAAGERLTLVPRDELARLDEQTRMRAFTDWSKTSDAERRKAIKDGVDRLAEAASNALGPGIARYKALFESPPDTWGMIVLDTVRQCMAGDENSSADAARFTAANREVARTLRCPTIATHHTSKANVSGPRASRGSVELTAGPDVIVSLETGAEHPSMVFTCRNVKAPDPLGFKLVDTDNGGVRFEVCEPGKRASKDGRGAVDDAEVLVILQSFPDDALTETNIRRRLAEQRGKPGQKANLAATQRALESLVTRGLATKVEIKSKKNGREKTFEGYRAGTDATPDEAKPIGREPDHRLFPDREEP